MAQVTISEWVEDTRAALTALSANRKTAIGHLADARKEKKNHKLNAICAEKASVVLQEIAQAVQTEAHAEIAGIVSHCLSAVFGDSYAFKITFERKRGKTEAKLVLLKDGVSRDPLTASGGGVADVAAFAARVAALVMSRPPLRRVMLLDEPFKYVSKKYLPAVRDLLDALAHDMGIQFIIITHIDALVCGNIIEVG